MVAIPRAAAGTVASEVTSPGPRSSSNARRTISASSIPRGYGDGRARPRSLARRSGDPDAASPRGARRRRGAVAGGREPAPARPAHAGARRALAHPRPCRRPVLQRAVPRPPVHRPRTGRPLPRVRPRRPDLDAGPRLPAPRGPGGIRELGRGRDRTRALRPLGRGRPGRQRAGQREPRGAGRPPRGGQAARVVDGGRRLRAPDRRRSTPRGGAPRGAQLGGDRHPAERGDDFRGAPEGIGHDAARLRRERGDRGAVDPGEQDAALQRALGVEEGEAAEGQLVAVGGGDGEGGRGGHGRRVLCRRSSDHGDTLYPDVRQAAPRPVTRSGYENARNRPLAGKKKFLGAPAPKYNRPTSGLPHERGVCMFDTNTKRFAGMAGITFVVLYLVAFIAFIPSGLPNSGDPASKVLAYAHVHRSALLTSAFLQSLAVIPWIAFVSGIVVMMRRSEGETGMWSMMAAIAGSIAAALAMVACAIGAMLVYRSAAGDAGLARTLLDGNAIAYAMGGLPVAVFIYAASQGL